MDTCTPRLSRCLESVAPMSSKRPAINVCARGDPRSCEIAEGERTLRSSASVNRRIWCGSSSLYGHTRRNRSAERRFEHRYFFGAAYFVLSDLRASRLLARLSALSATLPHRVNTQHAALGTRRRGISRSDRVVSQSGIHITWLCRKCLH